jgi:hypothetical protein
MHGASQHADLGSLIRIVVVEVAFSRTSLRHCDLTRAPDNLLGPRNRASDRIRYTPSTIAHAHKPSTPWRISRRTGGDGRTVQLRDLRADPHAA